MVFPGVVVVGEIDEPFCDLLLGFGAEVCGLPHSLLREALEESLSQDGSLFFNVFPVDVWHRYESFSYNFFSASEGFIFPLSSWMMVSKPSPICCFLCWTYFGRSGPSS